MKSKVIMGIMLTLLLIGMLTLTFEIQLAKADPTTIYVDDDNTTGPWDGTPEHPYQNIISGLEHASEGDTIYVYNGTYYEHLTIDKSLTLIGEDPGTTVIDGNGTGHVIEITADHVNVAGFTIRNGTNGILINMADYNIISGNIVTDNQNGIHLLATCPCDPASENTIRNNVIKNNGIGIYLGVAQNNVIYHNNFIDNTKHVSSYYFGCAGLWDDGYPSGGNYWSDYMGVDVKSGPNQDQPSSDGIGDTAYVIDANNIDHYPLMNPWTPTKVSVNVNGNDYPVIIVSNTTIDQISTTVNTLHFEASGSTGEKGYINVIFPMINTTEIEVFIDGVKLTPPPFPVISSNGTQYFIYFEFTLSTHSIDIEFAPTVPVGGTSVPVDKLRLLAPYIELTILLAVAVIAVGYVNKRKRD